ncbi:MAG: hypothetical protein Q8O67_07890 [Deltaproteobacteria bacterium]|nr:hypothetical protein [Deltaproteobacteria bacterium]
MSVVDVLRVLVSQAPPGSALAKGAIQRLAEPNLYDIVFPLIAFGLVIVLPVCTALWVIVRTVKDKTTEADEV